MGTQRAMNPNSMGGVQYAQEETTGEGLIVSMTNTLVAQRWNDTRDTEMVKGDQ